ncbi:unnamed protein product [Coregonus sp. 'balchen']|nr:unnamed protein product [Coregonus sp. 'balchen']
MEHRLSIHIVALGSESPGGVGPGEEAMGQGQLQGGLLWSYLGHGAVAGGPEESSLSNPAFMEYTSRVFGDVTVVVQDCPSWADILVIKYSVNDKLAFQQVRNGYAPRLRPLLHHWGMPVILVAVGARLNDWSSCVPHSEGLQLSRDLGATYLELPSLNHVFVSRYFGSVLEYFMIQCLKQKANERPEKRRGNKLNEPRPPHLEQPARLPPIRVEESSFSQDLQWLLERGVQFADVAFYSGDSGKELGWGHAAVLCAVSPYFRQLLLGPKASERPISRCACRGDGRGDMGPPSLLSTWDGGMGMEDGSRPDGHLAGRISRLVVKDPLLCLCLWETLMFLYRGSVLLAHRAVLVARCDVMAAMFSGKYAEARSRVVPIHGVSSDTFLSFLEYLYTDTCCPASVLQAMAVMVCAEMYQVKRLQHLCEVCVCAYLQSMPSRELASTGINEEREQVERLRWPSRGYLQELSEYQQRRRKLKKSRCLVM